ncbi:tetratricopeptide repeat-containing sensor histidine kinase [Mucilaginibacter xinganensis]|uniref:histidine kinase n=1 Tax=Mucilaginibacter xinganensis TaxID=1234841 RepID=A0A223NZH0_9SPHI|nr:ATP-binding protein [Mucilaginibacter xinganensis]ASU35216.1 Tetratricopeptide repeat-containing protein [Mucilaginibacter xinganensis]
MRVFILSLSLLLIFKISVAQMAAGGRSRSADTTAEYTQIDSLNNTAYNIYLTTPDAARKLAEDALLRSQKVEYELGKGRSFYNIGLIYWSQSYYTVSLFYLNSAINHLPVTRPLYLSDCFNALGRTYADLGNYNEAIVNLDKALRLSGKDSGRLAEVFSEKAYVYCALKNYNKAIADARYALQLNSKINATGNIAVLYARLGTIYRLKKDYPSALKHDSISYVMSKVMLNNRLRAKLYTEYAVVYKELNKYDLAISYAKRGVSLADSIGVFDAEKEGYKVLVGSYELKNDLRSALIYQKRYAGISDSVTALARQKTVRLIQNYHTLNSKLNDIKLMEISDRENKSKIKAQNRLILILLLSLLVLVSVLFVTFYLYKQKNLLSNKLRKQHSALSAQKELIEVQAANLQSVNGLKDKLLTVIGHDLRTPVANMGNIIEMFNDGYLTAAEVSDLMIEIGPVIKGAELTLLNLTEWAGSQIKGRNINSTNVDVFLLGVEMEQTFMHQLQIKSISFVNNAYAGRAVLADENHIKVILRNLVSNAIKFTGNNGNITLATQFENNTIIISISDTGKGMNLNEIERLFSINTHFSHSGTSGESGTGIGLLLCKELVELNGGKLAVRSAVGKGSTFYFNLPLIQAYV